MANSVSDEKLNFPSKHKITPTLVLKSNENISNATISRFSTLLAFDWKYFLTNDIVCTILAFGWNYFKYTVNVWAIL